MSVNRIVLEELTSRYWECSTIMEARRRSQPKTRIGWNDVSTKLCLSPAVNLLGEISANSLITERLRHKAGARYVEGQLMLTEERHARRSETRTVVYNPTAYSELLAEMKASDDGAA